MKHYLLIDHWSDGDLSLTVTVAFLSKLFFFFKRCPFFESCILSRNKNSSQNNSVFYVISRDYVFKKCYKIHVNIRIREHMQPSPCHGIRNSCEHTELQAEVASHPLQQTFASKIPAQSSFQCTFQVSLHTCSCGAAFLFWLSTLVSNVTYIFQHRSTLQGCPSNTVCQIHRSGLFFG